MTTKTQLQNKIQELEAELVEFKSQLGSYKETPTLQEANVGDTLEDGSIVLQKENGIALLVAPKITEVECFWSKEFSEVFEKLKEQGFNPTQWFVPTKEQLELAYQNIPNEFPSTYYWSSSEFNASAACLQCFDSGYVGAHGKSYSSRVRAFRCVTH